MWEKAKLHRKALELKLLFANPSRHADPQGTVVSRGFGFVGFEVAHGCVSRSDQVMLMLLVLRPYFNKAEMSARGHAFDFYQKKEKKKKEKEPQASCFPLLACSSDNWEHMFNSSGTKVCYAILSSLSCLMTALKELTKYTPYKR